MAFTGSSFTGSAIVNGNAASLNLLYNVVQLNGEGIVDKLRVLDYAMTDEEFDALSITDVFTWDEHTLLYAEFTNNLKAGSLLVDVTIDSWTIVRFCCGSNVPQILVTGLDPSETTYVDYTAIKPNDYYFRFYPISANAVISDIQSNTIQLCYDYYAFLDPATGESFTFKSNIGDGMSVQLVSGVTTYEGFTQYPAKSQSQIKYNTAPFSALLGNVESNVYTGDTVAIYTALQNFITNGNEKIMKDRKGNIRRVFTESLTGSINEKPSELPTTIAFQWTEVGALTWQ
jgi:hypothetical protein